ncbi:hypothetical protein DY000_02046035 [Brassica cretica]|uniref:Uncharacterized protein n=1 Tax=Brassica cretica TaxID=69181 RepID=A0ABQ7EQ46_BRACR|nr:hypothetical protein DY000_02046035 [Brassica cretica]
MDNIIDDVGRGGVRSVSRRTVVSGFVESWPSKVWLGEAWVVVVMRMEPWEWSFERNEKLLT